MPLTTRKDWSSDQEVRWCPGCGDYSILAAVQMLMPDLGVRRERTVFLSGIGCAARFPYYMNTYGMHSIHGRAPAIATGLATTRPDLDVWVVTGDGDSLSIGGNHLIHALRRNVNITILLFNNQIYGLTKGQYSPTSEVAKVTKSTPFGSLEQPFNPLSLALGAEASFVARTHDMDRKHMMETFRRAHAHKGASFVEIYQNCNVFNDGAFEQITGKEHRSDMLIPLVHGEPIRFGAEGQLGVVLHNDGSVEVVEVADVGEDALLVHDEHRDNPGLAFQLSRLSRGPYEPTPIGIFRDVDRPEYGEGMARQIEEATERRGPGDVAALLRSGSSWTVELAPSPDAGTSASPAVTTFVALLRSINVGGRNRVPMAELRALVGALGFGDVATYVQSGNVVFTGSGDPGAAGRSIRAGIADRLGLEVPVMVRSRPPAGPGARRQPLPRPRVDPKTLHVTFLAEPPDADHRRELTRLGAESGPGGAFGDDRFDGGPVRRLPLLPGRLRRDQAQQRLLRAPRRRGGHHPQLADRHRPGRHGRHRHRLTCGPQGAAGVAGPA